MASENLERNAATSRLTRPNDKATALDGRIATESAATTPHLAAPRPVFRDAPHLLASLPPADLICPHDVDNCVDNDCFEE